MKVPRKILSVAPLDNFQLKIIFQEGTRIVDMTTYNLRGIFKKISQDEKFFKTVYLDPEFNTVTWEGGLMLENNDLYEHGTPEKQTEVAHITSKLVKVLNKIIKS